MWHSQARFEALGHCRLYKGKNDTSKQDKLAMQQMQLSRQQHQENLAIAEAQLEPANQPIPDAPPTPPPVTETSADVAQAEDIQRKRLRAKSGNRSVFAGETRGYLGGVASSLGKAGGPA
jgi:hypothetical protein